MSSLSIPSSTHIPSAPEYIVELALTEDFKEAFLSVLNDQRIEPKSRKIKRNYIYDPFLKVLRGEKIAYKDYIFLHAYAQDSDFISKIFEVIKEKKGIQRLDEYLELIADKKKLALHFEKNLVALKVKFALEGKIPDSDFKELTNFRDYRLVQTIDDEGIEELSIVGEKGNIFSPVKVWKKGKVGGIIEDVFIQNLKENQIQDWSVYWETPDGFMYYDFGNDTLDIVGGSPISSFETHDNVYLVYESLNSIWLYSVCEKCNIFSIQFQGKLSPSIERVFVLGDEIVLQYLQDTGRGELEILHSITQQKQLASILLREGSIEKVFLLFGKIVVLFRKKSEFYNGRPIKSGTLTFYDTQSQSFIFPQHHNPPEISPPYELSAYEYGSFDPQTGKGKSPFDLEAVLSRVTHMQPASFSKDPNKPLDKHPDLQRSLTVPFFIYDASGNAHHLMISQNKEDIYQRIIQNPSFLKNIFIITWKKLAVKNSISYDTEAIKYYIDAFDELMSGELSEKNSIALYRVFSDDEFLFHFIQCFVEYCGDSSDIETRSMIEVLDFSKTNEDRQKIYDMMIEIIHLATIKGVFSRGEFFTQYQEIARTEDEIMYIHKQGRGYAFQIKGEVFFDITFGPKNGTMKGGDSEKGPDEEGYFTVQTGVFFYIYEKIKDPSSSTGWKIQKIDTLEGKVDDIFGDDDIFVDYSTQTEKIVYSTSLKKTFFSMDVDEGVVTEMKKTSLGYMIMVSIPKQVLPSETQYSPGTGFTIVSDIGKTIGKFTMIDGFEREGQESIFIGQKIGADEEYIIIDNLGNILFERVTKYRVTQDKETGNISLEGGYIMVTKKGLSPNLFTLPLHISQKSKQ